MRDLETSAAIKQLATWHHPAEINSCQRTKSDTKHKARRLLKENTLPPWSEYTKTSQHVPPFSVAAINVDTKSPSLASRILMYLVVPEQLSSCRTVQPSPTCPKSKQKQFVVRLSNGCCHFSLQPRGYTQTNLTHLCHKWCPAGSSAYRSNSEAPWLLQGETSSGARVARRVL